MGVISMQIRVQGVVPEGSNINISCCDQTKIIDTLDELIIFNVIKTENLNWNQHYLGSTKVLFKL